MGSGTTRLLLLFAITVLVISQRHQLRQLSKEYLEQQPDDFVFNPPKAIRLDEGSEERNSTTNVTQAPQRSAGGNSTTNVTQAPQRSAEDHLQGTTRELQKPSSTKNASLLLPEQPLQALTHHIRQQNCPADIDVLGYIRQRIDNRKAGQIPWQQQATLNDKWLFYLFAKRHGFNVPKMHFCATSSDDLEQWQPTPSINKQGFVVKIRRGRNSNAVYLLESGFGGREVLTNRPRMPRGAVIRAMKEHLRNNAKDFHVEEYLPGPDGLPPVDYKVFVADQSIAAVEVIANRGTENKCLATFNENFDRIDEHGCFSNNEKKYPPQASSGEANNTCRIPVEGVPYTDRKKCSDFAKPAAWDIILQTAKKVSKLIGIYVRLDLYFLDGKVYLGEATFLPLMGESHCASQLDEQGCIDSCVLGKFWKERNDKYNTTEGGPVIPEPEYMREWRTMSREDQCKALMAA